MPSLTTSDPAVPAPAGSGPTPREIMRIALSAIAIWVLSASVALGAGAEEHIAKLRAHPEILRNMAFQGVILSSGYWCRSVTHSFIRGAIPDGTVFVTVRCKDGDDYVIMENGIDEGAMVLTCSEASAIFLKMGVFDNCWTPIGE